MHKKLHIIKEKVIMFIPVIVGSMGVICMISGYYNEKLGNWGIIIQIVGAMLTVGSLIDAYISYKFYANRKKTLEELSITINDIKSSIITYTEQIALEDLRRIETELSSNHKTQCEIWILTNSLAVEKCFLEEILNNIVTKSINYYYVIREKDKNALETLSNQIKKIAKKKHKDCKGSLLYYCNNIIELLPAYSDIVVYIDESAPISSEKRRGFFCFQNSKVNGTYYYTEIKEESINEIVSLTHQLKNQFIEI